MNSAIVFAGLAIGIAAPGTKEEPKKKDADLPTIVGTCKIEKALFAGMEVPAGRVRTIEFTAEEKLLMHDGIRRDSKEHAYKVDTSKTPAQLDWITEGKKEQPIRGIFRIDGDTLMICIEDGFDSARPDKFEAPAGTKRMLWTLTRTTKKN
jgi:uncharacterized protein (TIGR03067 family)